MNLKKALPYVLIPVFFIIAALIVSAGPAAGPQAFAPAADRGAVDFSASNGAVSPVVVNLKDIPAGVYDPNNQFDRWQRGEIQLERGDSIIDRAKLEDLRVQAMNLAASSSISLAESGPGLEAPSGGTNWDSLDYTECCGGGGNVPPDPELAVGDNHVIAVVNVAFEIYNKSGTTAVAPRTFSSFFAADPNCTGVFDPNANYDESTGRYILGIDADGVYYCIAVSQTSDPTGLWNIYSFQTGSSSDFFDYPHAGVGRDAIYMGANIFRCRGPFSCQFKEGRVWAFDKAAMYAGQPAASATQGLPNSEDTPQPLNLHGWNQGTWPTSGPQYFFTETGYDGAHYTVWSWSNPFSGGSVTSVGTVDLVAATGVSAGMPVDTPQLGGQTIQANDFRPQDFEYRNGYAWSSMTIACNPGGGTVNCVRWAQIDPATATVLQAGVYASNGQYRTFADLAVDACDNMAVGYTKSSASMYPGIWVTGRESSDPAGTLQAETQLKAGEITYTSFESSPPRRWGDYTEMTIDPAGTTFWYLGEYSKNTGTSNGRWGTYIGSFSYACDPTPPPPTATPAPSPTPGGTDPTPTPEPTNTPSTSFSLSANGYKVRGQKYVDLTWTGATSSNVDIYRNGSLYTTTTNDGSETVGSLGNGGGSDIFKVCEAGTQICSNDAVVIW